MHFIAFLPLYCFTLLVAYGSLAAPTDPPICNGHAKLCPREYSNVTFIGAHDSAFVGILPTQNQIKSVTDQLNSGIRFLQAQTHSFLDSIYLCHTSCFEENAGTLQNYLSQVKSWLDVNPNDIVSLLLTNPDKVSMPTFASTFEKVGLENYAFSPPGSPNPLPMDAWPTLGDMIANNTRLVVFIDYGADQNVVSWLLDEFNYYFETPFDTTDPHFAECSMDRKNKLDSNGKSSMYIVNHFLDVDLAGILVPDKADSARTNAADGDGSISSQVALCVGLYERYPNVVLIDEVGRGNFMMSQLMMNGLLYA